ncbi:MAG: NfeD family protein, partial [Clostridia bacterium]|nr:NfeD family protein [Clostridia bacterium]
MRNAGDEEIKEGETVTVLKVEGVKLIVTRK